MRYRYLLSDAYPARHRAPHRRARCYGSPSAGSLRLGRVSGSGNCPTQRRASFSTATAFLRNGLLALVLVRLFQRGTHVIFQMGVPALERGWLVEKVRIGLFPFVLWR